MNVTCEACRTNFDAPEEQAGVAACPCCEHVNRPRGRVERVAPTPAVSEKTGESAEPGDSGEAPMKTMMFPADGEMRDTGVTAVKRLKREGRPSLSGAIGLTVVEQGKPPRHYPLEKPRLTIGRGRCDVRLHDPEVSRTHCVIEVFNGVPTIKDLQSANGTLLNGHLIREHILKDGDQIRIGATLLTLVAAKAA